ncbi:MAG: hypothetical protein JWP94_3027 [Mucilaginibacter sp.]|jgi:hypothetical protein|nr:hypothetical protein [Mucilaginibacter sp.]
MNIAEVEILNINLKLILLTSNSAIMKKTICLIALAAIGFGSIYAYGAPVVKAAVQQDTTKKKRTRPTKRDTTRKRDTMTTRKGATR